jgi:hypothetical protein
MWMGYVMTVCPTITTVVWVLAMQTWCITHTKPLKILTVTDTGKGLLVFSRTLNNPNALIALNFSDSDHIIEFTFETGGTYIEQLHDTDNL